MAAFFIWLYGCNLTLFLYFILNELKYDSKYDYQETSDEGKKQISDIRIKEEIKNY